MKLRRRERRAKANVLAAAVCAAAAVPLSSRAQTQLPPPPPRYDHVVVVVMENINYGEIPGSASAPYLNMLINQGASLSSAFAFKHTSAPEYGELFAGDENGIVDGVVSPNVPYTTPNLGAELRQKGYTFAGYSQSMPSVGYTGLTSGQYSRGHNPWVNWQNDAPNAHPNQLPSSTNVPFSLFPTSAAGFASLPTVSFVIPDNDHNMHNGSTLAQRLANGDNFMRDSLDGYYQWAKTHNSLLIVTADEDDRSGPGGNNNRIPTILAGANLKPGATVAQAYTLHNTLRTLEDAYGLSHAGGANYGRSIAGAFAGDATVTVATFQNGAGSYAGAHDTMVRADAPTTAFGTATPLIVDLDAGSASGNQSAQVLVRFDDVIGRSAGQVPADATVLSAKLRLWTATSGQTANPVEVHRMLSGFSESATWNSLGGGVMADDVVAASRAEHAYPPRVSNEPFYFDVSESVQAWLDGAPNLGWALLPTGSDDYQFNSSEATTASMRPLLEVAYALYPKFIAANGSWGAASNWSYGTPDAPAAVARFLPRATATSVTLDGNRAVGSLLFDANAAYTINSGVGGGRLTLANYGNRAAVIVKQGQHTLAVPVDAADPTVVDVAAGARLNATAGVTVVAGRSLTKLGDGVFATGGGLALGAGSTAVVEAGEMHVDRFIGAGGVTVKPEAVLRLTGGTGAASRLSSLTLEGTAKLDVGASGFALDYTGVTPLSAVVDQVKSARSAGWTGNGIGSSVAAANGAGAVAVGEASAVLKLSTGQTGTFMGQSVDATSLLVRYTLAGDATLDGTVDFSDLVQLAQNFNTASGTGGWFRGDFNYDGTVDFNDLVALAQSYNQPGVGGAALPADFATAWQAALAEASVPEPSVVSLLAATIGGLFRRRRRGSRSIATS